MVSADQMFQINHQAVVRDYYVEPRIGTSNCTRVLYLYLYVGRTEKEEAGNYEPLPCIAR